MKRILHCFSVLLILCACTQQMEEPYDTASKNSQDFTIEEAKDFFETKYSEAVTKATSVPHLSLLSPGDFTPLWNNADFAEFNNKAAFNVPILSDRKIFAFRATYKNGKAHAQKVHVYQKLIVKKNKDNSNKYSYILTLIPEIGHDNGARTLYDFNECGKKGNFSGTAVYTHPYYNTIRKIEKYRNGNKVEAIVISNKKGNIDERIRKAASMLSELRIVSRPVISTKSGEDYGWDFSWDQYEWIGTEDIGGEDVDVYEDADGTKYVDLDGDGLPDSILIDESVCTPDDDEEEEEEEEEEPLPDDPYDYYEDDYSPPDETINDDDYERGKQGVKKMKNDLKNGNVTVRQATIHGLAGFNLGLNTYSIFPTLTNFLDGAINDALLKNFGRTLGGAGIALTGAQTILVLIDEGELSTGDWLSLISATLGVAAFLPIAPTISGVVGVTSALIGIASFFISDTFEPGWYEIHAPNGEIAYLYINSTNIA